jgi:thiamine-phosphate pyrophosphorylase
MKKNPENSHSAGIRQVAVVTSGRIIPPQDLPGTLARLVAAGVNLIQIREKEMSGGDLVRLTRAVLAALPADECRVVVNGRLDVALAAGAHGVHLPGNGLPVAAVRQMVASGFLVGVSAHSPAEVIAAGQAGADYLFYGPVFATRSHPDTMGIGVRGLQAALQVASLPVWAIGGINDATVSQLDDLPLAGVACIRALLASDDPASTVQVLGGASTSRA